MILLFPIYKDVWEVKRPSEMIMCIGHRQREEGIDCVMQPGKCWVGALLQTRLSKASLFFNTHERKKKNKERRGGRDACKSGQMISPTLSVFCWCLHSSS